jgi:hypothetical protein
MLKTLNQVMRLALLALFAIIESINLSERMNFLQIKKLVISIGRSILIILELLTITNPNIRRTLTIQLCLSNKAADPYYD